MATGYPNAIDNYTNPTAADNLNTATKIHHDQHANVNDAVKAIETELGTNPKGSALSVKDRLNAIDVALAARVEESREGQASGIATLDGTGRLAQNVDGGKITTGSVALTRIPSIPGNKLIGTGSGGSAVPLDALPNIPASLTNSGTFSTARIPGLPASWITSGQFDAARLPASATANANSRMVADISGRDTILLADRADGMMVYVRQPAALFVWRADSQKWQMVYYRVVHNTATVIQSITTAYANVPGFSFPAEAGLTYGIKVDLFYDNPGSSSPKIKFGWTFPTGRMHAAMMGVDTNAVSPAYNGPWTGHAIMDETDGSLDETTGLGTPAGQSLSAILDATFECTTAGTVQLRFGQIAAAAQASRVLRGTRMEVSSF